MESKRRSKLSKWFRKRWEWICKNWWYLVLLLGSTIYVYIYRFEIYALTSINALAVGSIMWVILLILPLFSEFEFLGIKLKKELEKVSTEVKSSVDEIKNQIVELRVSNSNSNYFYIGQQSLPDKKEMAGLTNKAKNLQVENRKVASVAEDIDTSPDTIFLFKVRLKLEKILVDLCEKTEYKGNRSIPSMLQHIIRCELITIEIGDLAMQLVKIANRGVHGEIIDKEYLDFANTTYPLILDNLEEAQSSLQYINCRKCKYSGYTRHTDVCPRCGEYNME